MTIRYCVLFITLVCVEEHNWNPYCVIISFVLNKTLNGYGTYTMIMGDTICLVNMLRYCLQHFNKRIWYEIKGVDYDKRNHAFIYVHEKHII